MQKLMIRHNQTFINIRGWNNHAVNMAEQAVRASLSTMKKAVQLALGPDLENIKKDLADLKAEVRVIGVRQEEMDKRMNTNFDAVDTQIESVRNAVNTQIESVRNELRGLSEKVDWARDIEKLKIEVAELKKRR